MKREIMLVAPIDQPPVDMKNSWVAKFSRYTGKPIVCECCKIEANSIVKFKQAGSDAIHWGFAYGFANGGFRFFTVDHILPKSVGGSDLYDNLRIYCRNCNGKRGNKLTLDEFWMIIMDLKRYLSQKPWNHEKFKKFVQKEFPGSEIWIWIYSGQFEIKALR